MHKKTAIKIRKATRNRAKLHGTKEAPRLSVFRSNRFLSVQLIDDNTSKTLLSFSTSKLEGADKKANKTKQAEVAGAMLAKKAADAGIKKAVFDRGSYKYHGRVKALAEGARKAGLKI